MKIDITAKLIRSYFNGSCTEPEKKEVETWLQLADENYAQAMRWLKEEESDEDEKFLAGLLMAENEVLRRTRDSIEEKEGTLISGRADNKWSARRFWYLAAASVAAVILGVWVVRSHVGRNQVTLETGFNETRRVTLPDSSLLILNSNSSVSFIPSRFENERQVRMEGEVFFDIRHTSDHRPFQVQLPDDKVVEVLGTEFNVSERQDISEITLKSGKIRLDILHDKKRIDLEPGQTVKVDRLTRSVVKSNVNAAFHYAWINGKWKFDNTSLKEIAAKIEQIRGVKVNVYEPSLNKRTISGTIPLHGDNQTLVTNVANAFDLIVENRDGTFYLKERK